MNTLRTALAAPEPYDQQSLELCGACGWKAVIPGEPCLMCARDEITKERDSLTHEVAATQLAFEHWRDECADATKERDALMQAAKLALDALEDAHKYAHNVGRYLHGVPQAIAALKKAGVQ
jgi:hypothetical protein